MSEICKNGTRAYIAKLEQDNADLIQRISDKNKSFSMMVDQLADRTSERDDLRWQVVELTVERDTYKVEFDDYKEDIKATEALTERLSQEGQRAYKYEMLYKEAVTDNAGISLARQNAEKRMLELVVENTNLQQQVAAYQEAYEAVSEVKDFMVMPRDYCDGHWDKETEKSYDVAINRMKKAKKAISYNQEGGPRE